MNKMTLLYLFIGLIIITIIMSWTNTSITTEKDVESKDYLFKSDYFIQNVSIKYFDGSGLLESQLTANKLEYYKQNQTSLISKPLIEIINKKQSNWVIDASNGLLDHAQNKITLSDSVEIKQSAQNTQNKSSTIDDSSEVEIVIKTQNLNFDLNNNFAQTKNDVMIKTNTLSTVAKTMFIDFKLEKVDLKGQVQTTGFIE